MCEECSPEKREGDRVDAAYSPPFHMTDEITNLVIEIGELVGELSLTAALSPDPQLRRVSRIRSVYSSLAIENNTLSLDQVTDVIEGRRVLGPPRDIREVKNAYEAYERMLALDPGSQDDLLLAHRLMMQDLVPDAGCYRSGNVGVFSGSGLIHAGTPAAYVPEVMSQLFDWLRTTTLHPLIKSGVFHSELEFIHPFSDGNGRTGRLWHSLILQRWKPVFAWLPVESMIHSHQEAYYQAFGAANAQGDCTGFVEFMLTILRDTLRGIRSDQRLHVGENVGVNVGVNEEAVLTVLRRMPKASARTVAEVTNLSTRQVERILANLKEKGRIIRHGAPKNGFWEIAEIRLNP